MILKDTELFKYNFLFPYSVLGTSLLWRSTMAFIYLKVEFAKCLCLLPVVFSLGLGLKNFVLFTSLMFMTRHLRIFTHKQCL